MPTTSLLSLDQKLLEFMGDWTQVTLTTAIAASKLIVSTELNNYDHGFNGYFDNQWVYIEDKANAGVSRLLGSTAYATSSGTAYVFGANLTTDNANLATVRISHSSWADRKDAIITAARDIYPFLHKRIDDRTLITGNALPNGHFENDSSGTPTHYTLSNVTAASETTAGLYRGPRGTQSIKLTASSGNGYMYISSVDWPQLIDLRGQTVDFKCWMYPQTADDVKLVIWSVDPAGNAQTLSSTTTTYADRWTLVVLKDQTIQADAEEIQFRWQIVTNGQYCYIDDARVTGIYIHDYRLPDSITNGKLENVQIQVGKGSASSDIDEDYCDDISLGVPYSNVYGWSVEDDGLYKYLRIPYRIIPLRRLKLIAREPLETLSAASDTVSIDEAKADLLVAHAARILQRKLASPVTAEDVRKYRDEMQIMDFEYQRLLTRHKMSSPARTIKIDPL